MKKSTDAPVRLMQISAPISPPLSAGQNNPYRDIGVGRPPPGRGKKPSSQRPRQEQHAVCALFSVFLCVLEEEASLEGASGKKAMSVSAFIPLLVRSSFSRPEVSLLCCSGKHDVSELVEGYLWKERCLALRAGVVIFGYRYCCVPLLSHRCVLG
jgi:hypothetical protein